MRHRRMRTTTAADPASVMAVVLMVGVMMLSAALAVQDEEEMLHPLDFLALQSIRKSLSDMPGSQFFATWDFTADPCATFSGVFCNAGRVVALSLGDPSAGSLGLVGRLSPSLRHLSALSELFLVPGHVYGTIPTSISSLSNLRFLALTRNYLSGQIPASLRSLRRLHTLDLSFNQLSGRIPSPPSAIQNLLLAHNQLSGRIPRLSSTSLIRLDLEHNNLSHRISALPSSLQYLSLSTNRLSGPISHFLPKLRHLTFLDLSINKFSGAIPGVIFSFPIARLRLQHNMLSGAIMPLGGRVNAAMETVDLSYNMLGGTIPAGLAEARDLYMNHNRFVGRVPRRFVGRLMSGRIKIFYLHDNYLTGIEMERAAEIPVSSSVCLQYNCMVPPIRSTCPASPGRLERRPAAQCS